MKLETEFYLYLQRHRLEQVLQDSLEEASPQQTFVPATWVKLVHRPSAFSFDEALLLCQCSGNQWLAWVPDHGEALLYTDEFYYE